MTPERVTEVRERLDLHGGLDPLDTYDLVAEVERLHEAIAAAHYALTGAFPSNNPDDWQHTGGAREILRDALNPEDPS